jgi:hypothetical protein
VDRTQLKERFRSLLAEGKEIFIDELIKVDPQRAKKEGLEVAPVV